MISYRDRGRRIANSGTENSLCYAERKMNKLKRTEHRCKSELCEIIGFLFLHWPPSNLHVVLSGQLVVWDSQTHNINPSTHQELSTVLFRQFSYVNGHYEAHGNKLKARSSCPENVNIDS